MKTLKENLFTAALVAIIALFAVFSFVPKKSEANVNLEKSSKIRYFNECKMDCDDVPWDCAPEDAKLIIKK